MDWNSCKIRQICNVYIHFRLMPSRLFSTMSESNSQPTLTPKPRLSGVQTVLQYTGLPPSLLQRRPKLPSRNWLIFISFVTSFTGLYIYDRYECKRTRTEYVDRVKDLAEQPLHKFDLVRKVTVYGSRWPEDYEPDRGIKYFRKYVKVRY
jgi:import inner membrane translocase subunit TIM54